MNRSMSWGKQFFTAVLTVGVLSGCDDGTQPATCEDQAGEVRFAVDTLEVPRVRGAAWIRPTFVDGCGAALRPAASQATWSSSDTSVVRLAVLNSAEPEAYALSRSFGLSTVTVTYGDATGELPVRVFRPATEASAFTVVDSGRVGASTTDLWVHGDYAYSGTRPWTCGGSCDALDGWLHVWSVAGGGLERIDSLSLPAVKINDIKVSADSSFAVATQERGAPGENGIVVLDLADPAAPSVASIYTAGLSNGVHNVWIERIDGRDYVFTVESGSAGEGGVHVIDVTNRSTPTSVALFHAGGSFPHDVYVRDGLAFVSHWDAGLVILDVGNGMAGGAPDNPVEVGRVTTQGGNVHNAWYWPDRSLVFVGEEQFPPPDRIDEVGVVHVVDVSDMTAPVEVASYGVEGSTPHNFWLDEAREILFVGWYTNGLRAIDVSGALVGDLSTQGRELGHVLPSGFRGAASIWAPQLHDGVIYLADIYNGIWAVTYDG